VPISCALQPETSGEATSKARPEPQDIQGTRGSLQSERSPSHASFFLLLSLPGYHSLSHTSRNEKHRVAALSVLWSFCRPCWVRAPRTVPSPAELLDPSLPLAQRYCLQASTESERCHQGATESSSLSSGCAETSIQLKRAFTFGGQSFKLAPSVVVVKSAPAAGVLLATPSENPLPLHFLPFSLFCFLHVESKVTVLLTQGLRHKLQKLQSRSTGLYPPWLVMRLGRLFPFSLPHFPYLSNRA
jgi:hypothetical protein